MIMNGIIERLSQKYDSFYLYNERIISEYVGRLKRDFSSVEFLYSLKCNANPSVVKSIVEHGFGVDAASAGEVLIARKNGLSCEKIYYSAPGKTDDDIRRTFTEAVIIADSTSEIYRIRKIAEERKIKIKIGIRVNPNFSFDGERGLPSKFGIDEEKALEFVQIFSDPNVKIAGVHIHLKSQELNAHSLAEYYKKTLRFADKFGSILKRPLEFVNMGSGLGVSYSNSDKPLDTEILGKLAAEYVNEFHRKYPLTKILIETGRYVVGKCGVYVTKVLDKKISRGKTYLILKNTLNGFIRLPLARLFEGSIPCEPLYTCEDAFEFLTLKNCVEKECVTLAGNLCTSADIIAEDIFLPPLEIGDVIIITNAGAYGAALSPMQFSAHERAAEFFVDGMGKLYPIFTLF